MGKPRQAEALRSRIVGEGMEAPDQLLANPNNWRRHPKAQLDALEVMELDPRYCDVIVRRWQDFTGKPATHEGDGRTFDQLSSGIEHAEAA